MEDAPRLRDAISAATAHRFWEPKKRAPQWPPPAHEEVIGAGGGLQVVCMDDLDCDHF
jgi:hypothetical protein